MKKNLRNILTLALGFVTIFATAQDWDANSRTRVDMSGENDQFQTDQRTSLGVSWGGDGWGINVSGVHHYDLGTEKHTMDWNEAYATTDLMGYASVSVGRQAHEYGGGQLIGANDWGDAPQTRDGGLFSIDNDMVDLDFGLYKNQGDTTLEDVTGSYFLNASKSDGDWSVNLTYISNNNDDNAMGLDFGYAMMSGDLDLAVSYNTATRGAIDMDYMSIGATYNVNDDMSITATRTTCGDEDWNWDDGERSNYGEGAGSWMSHGNMGTLDKNDEDMSVGVSYSMGDFSLGLAMHKVTNSEVDTYERNVTEVNLGYTMSDNANVGIKYATDNDGDDVVGDIKYMWLTLSITP